MAVWKRMGTCYVVVYETSRRYMGRKMQWTTRTFKTLARD